MPPPSPEAALERPAAGIGGARAGRSPRFARAVLLGAVLLVAVCGFVYELVIIALGTYLLGNTVEQVAIVLASFVSAMGVGSLLAKPLLRRPLTAFVVVESAVGLLGGLSALALYAAFAWLDLYVPATVLVSALIGVLVGCEIPLLMALIQRVRREAAERSVADLLAADYLGAVVAGVAFPLVVLPLLGQIQAALAVGALNAAAGLVVLVVARDAQLFSASRRTRLVLAGAPLAVLGALGATALAAEGIELSARQALYDDPIVHSERTPYQEIVLTESGTGDVRLFLNGDLQFSSVDEYRYHEALVHPAMAGPHRRVLVLGGGDGLAVRDVLRHPGVERVVLVELDRRMAALGRDDPRLRRLNRGALADPRVEVVAADAFAWLRQARERFDVVLADFPDPDDAALAKLYSVELYTAVRQRVLARGGRLAVQAGSPFFAQRAFWSIERSVAAAGLATRAYHVDVPSFGDWGFVLAGAGGAPPPLRVQPPPDGVRFLDEPTLHAAAVFPADRRRPSGVEPTTLNRPRIVRYQREGYRGY